MTWVIASARHSGWAVAVADTQVSWQSEAFEPVNGLQKLYGIAPGLAAGFSGNVKLGFTLLGDLSRFVESLASNERDGLYGMSLGYDWWPRAYSRWQSSNLRGETAALLIFGVHPRANTEEGLPLPFVLKLSTDNPRPVMADLSTFISIGCAGDHRQLLSRGLHGLEPSDNSLPPFYPTEVDGPVGYLGGVIDHLARVLTRHPVPNVSVAMHSCHVLRDEAPVVHTWGTEPDHEIRWDHAGPLAGSWDAFRQLVGLPLAATARA